MKRASLESIGSAESVSTAEPSTARPSGAPRFAIPTVAVVGNPNAGKTTLFNRLTGLSQKVGNYPGVTVERKEGFLHHVGGVPVRLLDLPGTYSLTAHSPDEIVAVDVLLGQQPGEPRPELIVHVADASNLARNLYLLSQLLELGPPVLLVLNMVDIAERQGTRIDLPALSEALGIPVVATEGHRGKGIPELERRIAELAAGEGGGTDRESNRPQPRAASRAELPAELEKQVEAIHEEVAEPAREKLGRDLHPFEVARALVDRGGQAEERLVAALGEGLRARLESSRASVGGSRPLAALEAEARHRWASERVAAGVHEEPARRPGFSEKVDRILTHRFLGFAIFGLMMLLVFQSIFSWAVPLMTAVDGAFTALGAWVASALPAGMLRSLLVDGVIAGVGSVVVFLPQILILFLFIGLLEDCGYMARAAFLMDRVMAKCGLSGKSFIPMLGGFACAVPAIMATRVIEDRRDRLTTILVTPLMTCSARLPVYAILIGTFIPDRPLVGGSLGIPVLGLQALTLLALYVLGVTAAVAMAWLFKKTLLRGPTPPFILELPSYKVPSFTGVLFRLHERGKAFILRAGTIILSISIIVWALAYFPHPPRIAEDFEARREAVRTQIAAAEDPARRKALGENITALEREESGAYLRQSFFGRAGRAVQPVFAPLGWDWKISMAAIASFPAREVIVATLGTIYNLGSDEDETSPVLRERLREARWEETGRPVYNIAVALSIMVFFALCCQCGATLATIRRETNSWGWAGLTFGYMTLLAYLGALVTYQISARIFP